MVATNLPPKKVLASVGFGILLVISMTLPAAEETQFLNEQDAGIMIEMFDPENLNDSFASLSILFLFPEFHQAAGKAAANRLEYSNSSVRFAATYVLTNLHNPDYSIHLLAALDDPEFSIRVLAATGLVTSGHIEGIPVLIEALRTEAYMPNWDPPLQLWQLAAEKLLLHTHNDFGVSRANNALAASATYDNWILWWEESRNSLDWNSDDMRFESK